MEPEFEANGLALPAARECPPTVRHTLSVHAKAFYGRLVPWDGLSDEFGPIPTFPVPRRDEHGRLLPEPEDVGRERRDAIRRVLRALSTLPDATEEAVYEELSRALERDGG